jgi:hypothetical protein
VTLFVHRNAGGRCPCGAENAACGPPSDVVPADQLIEEVAAVSGPLKKYRVMRNGFETVMKLSDADAAKLGAGPYQVSDAVSTIEPVTAGDDSGGEVTGGEPHSAAAAMADAGAVVSEDLAVGATGAEPVQQSPKSEGDGQPAGDAPEQGGDPGGGQAEAKAADDGDGQAVAAPTTAATKAPARKRAASANKARTGSANKAADGGI